MQDTNKLDIITNQEKKMNSNLGAIVEKYIALRDKRAQLKAECDKEMAVLKAAMDRIELHFMGLLDSSGVDSMGTPFGTVFRSTVTSATVEDKEAFREYLLRSGEWGLADIRAAKANIKEFVDTNEDLPPGINWRSESVIRINRS